MELGGAERRRIFNENRRQVFGELERPIAFVCECTDPTCHATVTLTAAGYDAARGLAPGLLLADGHLPTALPQPLENGEQPDPGTSTAA